MERLQAYISRLCPLVLDFAEDSGALTEFESALRDDLASKILAQFATDTAAALFIEFTPDFQAASSDPGSLNSQGGVHPESSEGKGNDSASRFLFGLEPRLSQQGVSSSMALVKTVSAALKDNQSIASQLRVIKLDAKSSKSSTSFQSAQNSNGTSESSVDEESLGTSGAKGVEATAKASHRLDAIYDFVHHTFAPILRAISIEKIDDSERGENDGSAGKNKASMGSLAKTLPVVSKKLQEFEYALKNCMQHTEIPTVSFQFEDEIVKAVDACNAVPAGGSRPSLEELGFQDNLQDSDLLKRLAKSVKRWTNDIQKVTKLDRDIGVGAALQEINFWRDMELALESIESQVNSTGVELTVEVLEREKQFYVTLPFQNETNLKKTKKKVEGYMQLLKEFPINAVMTSPDLKQLTDAVLAVFGHLKRMKSSQYPIARAFRLMEAVSRDLSQQIVALLAPIRLMKLPYNAFLEITNTCTVLFRVWDEQTTHFRELARDVAKKRGEKSTMRLTLDHRALQTRIEDIRDFRKNHEKLREVISSVLPRHSADKDAVPDDVSDAFQHVVGIDVLDVSKEGVLNWESAKRNYEIRIDRVESQITEKLTDLLATANTGDEKFRVFSKFNALFFRHRIRGAIQQHQAELIKTVKEDIQELQNIFKRSYSRSEAERMSGLRDLPPMSGKIIWAKQIERQLSMYIGRIEAVLGKGWERHTDGRTLKSVCDSFKRKLDTQPIFDEWMTQIQYVRDTNANFEVSGRIFAVEKVRRKYRRSLESKSSAGRSSPSKDALILKVSFDPQIIMLFKEVRNLAWLNQSSGTSFRVPYTLRVISEEAKEKYPFAMALNELLRTYQSSLARVDKNLRPLIAGLHRDVQSKIYRAYKDHVRWDSEGLELYVKEFSEQIYILQDSVTDLLGKASALNKHIEVIKQCEYSNKGFGDVLADIQKVVDELNLADYTNLESWTRSLDRRIEDALLERLASALIAWTNAFRGRWKESGGIGLRSTENDDADERGSKEDPALAELTRHFLGSLPDIVLELTLRNQVLILRPPLAQVRVSWHGILEDMISVVCDLPRIQSSRYDDAFSVSPNRKATSFASNDGATFDSTYGSVVRSKLSAKLFKDAFALVESNLQAVGNYVEHWFQYQALWDMSVDTILSNLGDSVEKWQKLLRDIKAERSTFDNHEQEKLFGFNVVDYAAVQMKVNNKYNAWHSELLQRFGKMLGESMSKFHNSVQSARTQLEICTLDADTSEVIEYVTIVQGLRQNVIKWSTDLDTFKTSQRLLQSQRFSFPSDWMWLANIEGEWEAFSQILDRKWKDMESRIPSLQKRLLNEDRKLEASLQEAEAEWKTARNEKLIDSTDPMEALRTLNSFETHLSQLQKDSSRIVLALDALDLTRPSKTNIDTMIQELRAFSEVWKSLETVWGHIEEIRELSWRTIVPRKVRASLDVVLKDMDNLPPKIQQYEAFMNFRDLARAYKSSMLIITELRSNALKDRHWRKVSKILNLGRPVQHLVLGDLLDALGGSQGSGSRAKVDNEIRRGIEKQLKTVISQAQGEMALEHFLQDDLKDAWGAAKLELVDYHNKTSLIRGWEDLFGKLDDNLSSLSSMKQSPYFKVFEDDAIAWEEKLTRLRVLFDLWIDVQRRWVYLEGIFFGSADIKQQLPNEFARFKSIDQEFVQLMRAVRMKPGVLDVLALPNVQRTLERVSDLLDKIQRALGAYLERQRAAFPRFYFVGDEDLLEIIGNCKDPLQVQRHVNKMFAAISTLEIETVDGDSVIKGMISKEGEAVSFDGGVRLADLPKINEWLGGVERQMQVSLATSLQSAVPRAVSSGTNLKGSEFLIWSSKFPAQIVLLATSINWSDAVEKALVESNIDTVLENVQSILKLLADEVLRENLEASRRKTYEQLITELVHQRDASRRLRETDARTVNDFEWIYQLRYYWKPKEEDLMHRLSTQVANASFFYGFEYLGVSDRLVQTPLTDRCYLTLTQALHMRMGGNPFGPAGTGKTESVKMLGAMLGRFVLVFNCDEAFDFNAMGRIFVGLCQVGAWGCFDEFNRLEERILSAVSQQILLIQVGLQQMTKEIQLLGKPVSLNSSVGIFVTMNPGYAGRSNLPDNLKQLFRGVAMMRPDYALIAQVIMFSQGFRTAEGLAGKVVLLFRLCVDQLSTQPHYDFGLRALKSVLASAGNLKRETLSDKESKATSESGKISDEALKLVELQVLIKSVCETVVPKLVAADIPLFKNLLSGVFPSATEIEMGNAALRKHILNVCSDHQLVPQPHWIEKVIQLHLVQHLRHGVMMVGPSGAGKTSAWKILLEAMHRHDGIPGEIYVIDAKAITKDQLYGKLDATTLEWTDGIFTHILRAIINNVRNESSKRHWIVFDCDVDPEWAENLNSVLDDNKLLTLPSGERLSIPPNVRIMFETETLRYATAASVSRCGMVWFSKKALPIDAILQHHLLRLKAGNDEDNDLTRAVTSKCADAMSPYFSSDALIVHILDWAMDTGEDGGYAGHVMEVNNVSLITSMMSLVSRGIKNVLDYNESHQGFPMSDQHLNKYITKWLVFSILWGFGGSMSFNYRVQLGKQLSQICTIPLPSSLGDTDTTAGLIDYEVNPEDGEWRLWLRSVPQTEIESHQVLSTDIVIPTVDTVRHVEVLHGWLAEHRPLILCGPPGSGKTMTLTSVLTTLPNMELASLNFSSSTTPDLILKTFEQYCEYHSTRSGPVLAPISQGKWLVVFCDEINLPENDSYGTQHVIMLLRQLTEQGGFWRARDNQWVKLERIQFVGACNPPTDPGRVAMSARFLRHAPLLLVDYPAPESLRQIYGTFCRGLLKLHPSLRAHSSSLTEAMVDFYHENQTNFTADKQPHYVYSPRELSRWVRAMYEATSEIAGDSLSLEEMVRVWLHEGLRLFHDRLVDEDERSWCQSKIDQIAVKHFPAANPSCLARPVLFSNWMSNQYVDVNQETLREHVTARLKTFYEEELNVKLVVFDEVLDHVLRIDRVLRQPLGHLLLVGESGAGKTVLSRFCAWRTGLSVFQIKITRKYTIDSFDEDLRIVMKRTGCEDEKICFIFDESNVLNTAFLERMNSLLASGEIPGLYEGDEYTTLMADCRSWAARNNVMFDSEDELFRHFTRNVQKNLHVVFTMNPASGDFDNRAATSPALFNRCVVDWFGDWSRKALSQVGRQFTVHIDVEANSDSPYNPEPAAWELVHRLANGISDDNQDTPAGRPSLHDAVVATMVFIHENVKFAGVKHPSASSQSQKTQKFVSPRDYIDFIHHVVSLHDEKRSKLEEQQLHLNIGLDKLAATATQVAKLQQGLSEKEALLSRKNKEANEKLQQMVKEQNIAEQQKREAQELKTQLDERNAEVDRRRAIVEADLAKAEPALKEAQAAVRGIEKKHLDEIRSLSRPPPAVRLTMEAVCMMINPERVKDHTWRAVRSDMRGAHFKRTVEEFASEDITPHVRKIIKSSYIEGKHSDQFNYEKVHKASHATGPLYKWIVSQIDYAEIKERIAPLRNEVEQLAEESKDLIERHKEVESSIVQLETSIAQYKVEYAELIKETEAIKGEMDAVLQKCSRAETLLGSLSEEQQRWEEGSATFQAQLSTLLGDVLLAAAFISYIGFFDHHMREQLLQKWQAHLSFTGIAYKEDLSLVEYLSTASERITWAANALPNDDLCVENAIILKRFHRYPLVIDPSGQAIDYLKRQNASESRRVTVTSFLDSAFMKQVESALRFGTCLLVQDVENVDPILNPVLNREFQKTGGRVLVRLGSQDIDFSPSFSMYMTTRDPLFQFTPDLCSRVTFVNFTVTPSSLTSQCLSKVLRVECPEVDQKRGELLKLQGEYRARLRELEDKLLEAINTVKGNILDDDTVIHTLEVLKKDAADISAKAASSESILVEVERTSNEYLPLARMCSKVFFTLDGLGQISPLYQYGLSFFLDLIDDVLGENHQQGQQQSAVAGTSSGVDHLAQRIFQESFTRCARGLLNQDKLLLAMRFAQIKITGTPDEVPGEVLQSFVTGSIANATDDELLDAAELISKHLYSSMKKANETSSTSIPIVPLTSAQKNCLGNLFSIGTLKGMESHMKSNIDEWAKFMSSSDAENLVPVNFLNERPLGSSSAWSKFVEMAVVRVLRPDRFTMAAQQWVDVVFNKELPVQNLEFNLQTVVTKESHSRAPIMLCSRPGFDASSKVDDMAASLGVRYQSLAMGSEEGFQLAEKYVSMAAKNGTWVLLRNVHLCPIYMVQFEKKLHSLAPHDDFRVFLTAEINDKLPTSLLRMSQTFVFEPPAGIKASLTRSLSSIPADRMDKLPAERSRLYFLLAWFHATVIERLQYAPIGWSKRYEFSETDFRCALSSFDDWIDSVAKGRSHIDPEEIPWSALHAMLGQSLYGGRIDNPFDQRLLNAFIEKLFSASSFLSNFELADGVKGPEGIRRENFLSWLKTLPEKNPPTWLGLTPSAEDMLLTSVGDSVVRKFALMQNASADGDDEGSESSSQVSSSSGILQSRRSYSAMSGVEGQSVPAWIQRIATNAKSWLEMLPEVLPIMERGSDSEDAGALFRCFDREAGVASVLLSEIRSDLKKILAVSSFMEKPTNTTRALMDDLHRGILPERWGRFYAYSKEELSASSWVTDLIRRLKQLSSLTSEGPTSLSRLRGSSKSTWLGGLFYPGAFVAATRQVEAQRLGVSLEELRLEVVIGNGDKSIDDGYRITGLALEGGAIFEDGLLKPSRLMRQLLPDTFFRWVKANSTDSRVSNAGRNFKIPVYLDSTRLNFVLEVELPTAAPAQKFATRGTALIAWSTL